MKQWSGAGAVLTGLCAAAALTLSACGRPAPATVTIQAGGECELKIDGRRYAGRCARVGIREVEARLNADGHECVFRTQGDRALIQLYYEGRGEALGACRRVLSGSAGLGNAVEVSVRGWP